MIWYFLLITLPNLLRLLDNIKNKNTTTELDVGGKLNDILVFI